MKTNEEIKIQFCPKCNSTKIKFVHNMMNTFGWFPRQKCMNCGYEARAFPILEKKAKEDRK